MGRVVLECSLVKQVEVCSDFIFAFLEVLSLHLPLVDRSLLTCILSFVIIQDLLKAVLRVADQVQKLMMINLDALHLLDNTLNARMNLVLDSVTSLLSGALSGI